MSTRCQIGFYPSEKTPLNDWEALIYRHSDGYPEEEFGVIKTIAPILQDFHRERGLEDIEYSSAWLVAKLKTDFLNIGITKKIHSDIRYFYHVSPQGIRVFEIADDFYHNSSFENMKEIKKFHFKFKTKPRHENTKPSIHNQIKKSKKKGQK